MHAARRPFDPPNDDVAWLFFFTRCVHSAIHLGTNNVSVRFFTFGVSLVFLAGIWIALLVSLLASPA